MVAAADAAVVGAPALSKATALSANPLQRGVWACEAGAQAGAGGHARFFLGTVDHGSGLDHRPPLQLTKTTLTGMGQMSNDKGFFNIRFSCELTPQLDKARAFTSAVLSPAKLDQAPPRPPIPPQPGKAWYVTAANRPALVHGIEQTDDRDFLASCAAKSGAVEVRLAHTAPWLSAGGYATVAITANGKSLLYVARGVKDEGLGAVIPVIAVGSDDPLFAQMAAGTGLTFNIGADTVYGVLLGGAAAPVRSFVAGCARR